jgi:hypothetical protein
MSHYLTALLSSSRLKFQLLGLASAMLSRLLMHLATSSLWERVTTMLWEKAWGFVFRNLVSWILHAKVMHLIASR